MQFLRLGLVNHTTLGKTFQKENKDIYIIIGMVADACECLMCIICILLCLKLNHDVKNNRFKSRRKEGAFFVQVVSDKDIVVIQSKQVKNKTSITNYNNYTIQNNILLLNKDKNLKQVLESEIL